MANARYRAQFAANYLTNCVSRVDCKSAHPGSIPGVASTNFLNTINLLLRLVLRVITDFMSRRVARYSPLIPMALSQQRQLHATLTRHGNLLQCHQLRGVAPDGQGLRP